MERVILVCKHQARATAIMFQSAFKGEYEVLASMFSRYSYVTEYESGGILYIEVSSHIAQ